ADVASLVDYHPTARCAPGATYTKFQSTTSWEIVQWRFTCAWQPTRPAWHANVDSARCSVYLASAVMRNRARPDRPGTGGRGPLDSKTTKPFKDVLRDAKLRLLQMHYESGVGHIGGNLSALDFLMCLYHRVLGPDDAFVLSKGHAAGALYITLWS